MKKDAAIKAATSVARDVAEGKLDPEDLDRLAVEECRRLFADVAGPGDVLWPMHVEIARAVLSFDGIPWHELVEWAGVHRDRPPIEANAQPNEKGVSQTHTQDGALTSDDEQDGGSTLGESEDHPGGSGVGQTPTPDREPTGDESVLRDIEALIDEQRRPRRPLF